LAVAEQNGVEFMEVRYMKEKPDRATLTSLAGMLEDAVEDLVRKDSYFKKLGLNADDYVGNPDAVVDILVQHARLLQRPVIVRGNKAIIGRPRDRVPPFLS